MRAQVQLGFTVPEGVPYYIPLHHMSLTGMSNLSGKTTAAEAILRRAKRKSLVWLTKRGEKTFADAETIPPYYRERFDWEYVRSLLESSMKERLKFETPWIMRICKQAQIKLKGKEPTIGEGLRVVRQLLGSVLSVEKGIRDLDRNMYTLLAGYMDKVLPILEQSKEKFSSTLHIKQGLNIMNLMPWYTHEEVQMLSIRACMEYILEKENDTQLLLPESWKMLPQGRNTPVKLYFEKFIREGATNNNFLMIDAQDLGGVDKTPLRQVGLWIMGKMMEAHEVERLLKQTLGLDISAKEIQTLPLGHFIVANGIDNTVAKVYVWPWGVPEEMAMAVAKGQLKPETVQEFLIDKFNRADIIKKTLGSGALPAKIEDLEKRLEALSRLVENNEQRRVEITKIQKQEIAEFKEDIAFFEKKIEDLHGRSLTTTVDLEHKGIVINVHHEGEQVVKMSTKTVFGKLLYCAVNTLPKEGFTVNEMNTVLIENGWAIKGTTLSANLSILASKGKLVKTEKGYRLPAKVKFNILREKHGPI